MDDSFNENKPRCTLLLCGNIQNAAQRSKTNAFITFGGPRAQTRPKAQPLAESGARGPPKHDERMFYHGNLIFSQNLDMFKKKSSKSVE